MGMREGGRMKVKRWASWLLGALFVVFPVVVIRGTFTTHRHNEANRSALVTLHGSTDPGDTREQVLGLLRDSHR